MTYKSDTYNDNKKSVRVASTGNVSVSSAPASIDGITLSSGDRILLKDQTTASENGIYKFNGASSALTRTLDADQSLEITSGLVVYAEEGNFNAKNSFALTTSGSITIGSTSLIFENIANITRTIIDGGSASSSYVLTTDVDGGIADITFVTAKAVSGGGA